MSRPNPPPRPAPPGRGELLALAGVLAFGVGLRVLVSAIAVVISKDGSSAIQHAFAFAHGHWEVALDHPQHPLLAMTMALPMMLGLDPLPSAQLVMVLTSSLALVFVWLLARDVGGRAVALLATLFASVLWIWLETVATVLSEPLYGMMLAACAWCGWRAVRDGGTMAHLGFAVSGVFAYLTRPEGLILPAVASLFLLERILRDTGARRHRLLASLAGLAVAVALASPYVVYMSRHGELVLSLKKAERTRPITTQAEREAIKSLVRGDRERPAAAAAPSTEAQRGAGAILNDLQEGVISACSPPVFVLLVAALILAGRWRARDGGAGGARAHLYLAAILSAYLGVFAWHVVSHGYIASRQVANLDPLVFPWAAMGLLSMADLAGGRSARRWWAVVLVLLAIVTGMNLHKGLRRHGSDKAHELEAAAAVRVEAAALGPVGPPGGSPRAAAMVMGNVPRISFYAGCNRRRAPDREPWMLPDEWRAVLEESLAEVDRPDFFAVDRHELASFEPILTAPSRPDLQIELLGEFPARRKADDVVVYRVIRR